MSIACLSSSIQYLVLQGSSLSLFSRVPFAPSPRCRIVFVPSSMLPLVSAPLRILARNANMPSQTSTVYFDCLRKFRAGCSGIAKRFRAYCPVRFFALIHSLSLLSLSSVLLKRLAQIALRVFNMWSGQWSVLLLELFR